MKEKETIIKKAWDAIDNLTDKSLQSLQEALTDKDKKISELEEKTWRSNLTKADLGFEKETKLTKISGILTSNLRTRKSTDVPYMAFFRPEYNCKSQKHSWEECEATKCQECEIPVVFRIDSDNSSKCCKLGDNYHNSDCPNLNPKPTLKKGNRVILEGKFENSKKSNRLSFTCYSYQVLKGDEE